VVEAVPALVIPVTLPPQQLSAAGSVMVAIQTPTTSAVVVELDRATLTTRVLPELVERYFPDRDSSQYRISISDNGPKPLYVRGTDDPGAVTPENADVVATFFSAPHFERVMHAVDGQALAWQFEASAGSTDFARTMVRAIRPAASAMSIVVQERTAMNGGWRIALQHGAGSLDAAVAQARQRNLVISFSILSVLAFGVGLIVVNARRSEKLAAQQMDFVATVSHELRTPLAVIRSAAQNLSAGVVEDHAGAKRYGELIETEGRRLTHMVEEVLEFAGLSGQRRALSLKAVDVASLVQDVVASSAALIAAAEVEAEVTVADDVPLVMTDEEALRRAISNLLTNALKHGADGRWVGLSVTRVQRDGRDEVQIAVADRGRGIDAADLPHVFETFYRGRHAAERQIQGNGLGLSLVSRISESHGGRVTVASTPQQGATFTMSLPVPADLAGD
jgi:signal transduction histidine kinase